MMNTRSTARNPLGSIEAHGVEYVPEDHRRSRPRNVFVVLAGVQLNFALIVIGFLPIVFGLSLSDALLANTIGIVLGCVIFAPSAIFGSLSGTNGPVASGAFFGVKGRIIGSLIGVFISIGAAAIAIWISGQVLVAAIERMFSISLGSGALAVAFALLAAICIIVTIYGHSLIVRLQWIISVPIALLILFGIVIFWPNAVAMGEATAYITGDFASTMVLAVIMSLGVTVSYALQVNDYTRYISPKRYSLGSTVLAAGGGAAIGLLLAINFGTVIAAAAGGDDPVSHMVSGSPLGFVIALAPIALAGALGQAVLDLYATGLDTSSIIPRLRRVPATLLVSGISVAVVYLGAFVWDALDMLSAFVSILVTMATPWLTISYLGFAMHRGKIYPLDLQTFNQGQRGGAYWYRNGWSLPAVVSWLIAVIVGLLFSSTSVFVGPMVSVTAGLDLSVIVSAILGPALYACFAVVRRSTVMPDHNTALSTAVTARGSESPRSSVSEAVDSPNEPVLGK